MNTGAVACTLTGRDPKRTRTFDRKVTRAFRVAQTGIRTSRDDPTATWTDARTFRRDWNVSRAGPMTGWAVSRIDSQPETGRPDTFGQT